MSRASWRTSVGAPGASATLHPDFGSGVWPAGSDSPIGIPYIEVGPNESPVPIEYDAYAIRVRGSRQFRDDDPPGLGSSAPALMPDLTSRGDRGDSYPGPKGLTTITKMIPAQRRLSTTLTSRRVEVSPTSARSRLDG